MRHICLPQKVGLLVTMAPSRLSALSKRLLKTLFTRQHGENTKMHLKGAQHCRVSNTNTF